MTDLRQRLIDIIERANDGWSIEVDDTPGLADAILTELRLVPADVYQAAEQDAYLTGDGYLRITHDMRTTDPDTITHVPSHRVTITSKGPNL